MTAKGEFFAPNVAHSGDNLPLFVGDQQNQKQMLKEFFTFQKQLKKVNLNITTLWLTPTGSWRLQVTDASNNLFWVYLGTTKTHELMDGFITAYPLMMTSATPGANLIYVDLRYHTGYAAKWTVPPKTPKSTSINPARTVS